MADGVHAKARSAVLVFTSGYVSRFQRFTSCTPGLRQAVDAVMPYECKYLQQGQGRKKIDNQREGAVDYRE
jgi:hypothetical protein